MSDSRKLAVLAALFVIFGCVASDRIRRPIKVTTPCCKSVSSKIPKRIRDEIISYTHQNALGPCVHAIIFQTKNNGKVCTDPNARWVPKKLKELQNNREDNVEMGFGTDSRNYSRQSLFPDHYDRRPTKVITCCESVTSMIPRKIRDEIISYTHQNALGPCVHAITFWTKNNGKVCTNPNARWVPKKLKELQKQS